MEHHHHHNPITITTTTIIIISFLISLSSSADLHPTVQRLCEEYNDATPCHDLMTNTMQPELLKALTDILSDVDNCINRTIVIETSLLEVMYTGAAPPRQDSVEYHTGNGCVQIYVRALAEFMGAVQELQLGGLDEFETRMKNGLRLHQQCDLSPAVPLLDVKCPTLKDTPKQVKVWVDNVVAVHEQSKKILNGFRDKLARVG